jgi:hypothetical protein
MQSRPILGGSAYVGDRMPLENECKYILKNYDLLEAALRQEHDGYLIDPQAYLHDRGRIRRLVYSSHIEHIFSFKQTLRHGEFIEIETPISETDFLGLLPFSLARLTKYRITVSRPPIRWDIDFVRWVNGRHFVVAEAEMPPGMEEPPSILDVLLPHLVYIVPRCDRRFSARRLTDPIYAKGLAIDLGLA